MFASYVMLCMCELALHKACIAYACVNCMYVCVHDLHGWCLCVYILHISTFSLFHAHVRTMYVRYKSAQRRMPGSMQTRIVCRSHLQTVSLAVPCLACTRCSSNCTNGASKVHMASTAISKNVSALLNQQSDPSSRGLDRLARASALSAPRMNKQCGSWACRVLAHIPTVVKLAAEKHGACTLTALVDVCQRKRLKHGDEQTDLGSEQSLRGVEHTVCVCMCVRVKEKRLLCRSFYSNVMLLPACGHKKQHVVERTLGEIQIDRQKDRQKDRNTDRQTDRQTDRHPRTQTRHSHSQPWDRERKHRFSTKPAHRTRTLSQDCAHRAQSHIRDAYAASLCSTWLSSSTTSAWAFSCKHGSFMVCMYQLSETVWSKSWQRVYL
jgi:hypothetical protein